MLFCFSYNDASNLTYAERLAILNISPLYNRLIYLSASFIIKCLFCLYDMPQHILPSPRKRKLDTLLFTHEFARCNALKFTCFHSFARLWETIPKAERDLCLDPNVNIILNALREVLCNMSPIDKAF